MKKITAVVLLFAIASMPALAADDNAYTLAQPDMYALDKPASGTGRADIERMTTFSLLQSNNNFSLSGRLSIPRLNTGDALAGAYSNAPTYGLRGQFDSTPNLGIRFGWDRYVAGQNTDDNLYSLTAVFKF
jgi:hypothetical protein